MKKKIVLFSTIVVIVLMASHEVLARGGGGDRGGGGRGGGERGGSGYRSAPGPSRSGPGRSYQGPAGPGRSYKGPAGPGSSYKGAGPGRSYMGPAGPGSSVKMRPYGGKGVPAYGRGGAGWNRPGRGAYPAARARIGYGVGSKYAHRRPYPYPYPYRHWHHRPYYPGWRPGWWTLPVAWGVGSAWWNWNTGPYYNPYAVYIDNPVYDYSTPVYQYTDSDEVATDQDEALTSTEAEEGEPLNEKDTAAMRYFETARESFKAAEYTKSLEDINRAIRLLPSDAALHEFRALALFATGKYNQAAAVVNSVLASGPGWDWDTMIGLYKDPEAYTRQLRDLEKFVEENEKDPAAKFLLAYQYLVMGYTDKAKAELEEVVRLQPKDILAKRILTTLDKAKSEDTPAPPKPQ